MTYRNSGVTVPLPTAAACETAGVLYSDPRLHGFPAAPVPGYEWRDSFLFFPFHFFFISFAAEGWDSELGAATTTTASRARDSKA